MDNDLYLKAQNIKLRIERMRSIVKDFDEGFVGDRLLALLPLEMIERHRKEISEFLKVELEKLQHEFEAL